MERSKNPGNIESSSNFFEIDGNKEIEKQLKLKTNELQDYVDNANVGLHWVDADGMIKWANKAELDMLGYTAEEYIGHHITEFHVNRNKIDDILYKLGCNEVLNQYESELLCKDGTIKTVHINSSVYRDEGKFVHTRCFTVDVSEQKRLFQALTKSEQQYKSLVDKYRQLAATLEIKVQEKTQDLLKKGEELKKSEELYHSMIEQVEDYVIILLDKDGTVLNWNRGAEKIKGYKEDEIVGKNFQEFYLEEDKKNGLPSKLLQLAIENGKAIHEGFRRRKDGSTLWASVVLTALHDNEGKLMGFSKVTRDLTEKKVVEDRMNEYLSRLEFQNSELEQFVYAASHDMKEPLRKIHFYNEVILENTSNSLDNKSREYLNRSINAAARMTTLIEDLLVYSKSTFSTDGFGEVDLNAIIDEIIMQTDENGFKSGKIFADKVPLIRGVAFQIKQLMYNLINNSIKYRHPDREVEIKINWELVNGSDVPWQFAETQLAYNKISVIDNGIGFEQKFSGRMFEIFQRLNNVANRNGSGIGLAICKKIVQNHRGYITATGTPGMGACFSIYIPAYN